MTTAVFVLSKNNVPNRQAGNAHASPTRVPGCASTEGGTCISVCVCVQSLQTMLQCNLFMATKHPPHGPFGCSVMSPS